MGYALAAALNRPDHLVSRYLWFPFVCQNYIFSCFTRLTKYSFRSRSGTYTMFAIFFLLGKQRARSGERREGGRKCGKCRAKLSMPHGLAIVIDKNRNILAAINSITVVFCTGLLYDCKSVWFQENEDLPPSELPLRQRGYQSPPLRQGFHLLRLSPLPPQPRPRLRRCPLGCRCRGWPFCCARSGRARTRFGRRRSRRRGDGARRCSSPPRRNPRSSCGSP